MVREPNEMRHPHSLAAPEPDLEDIPSYALSRWVFESGVEAEADQYGQVHEYPYRTVFAVIPGALDDREPLADLAENEVPDEVGQLISRIPDYIRLAYALWVHLDHERSQDARYLSPRIRELQDELGALLRESLDDATRAALAQEVSP